MIHSGLAGRKRVSCLRMGTRHLGWVGRGAPEKGRVADQLDFLGDSDANRSGVLLNADVERPC